VMLPHARIVLIREVNTQQVGTVVRVLGKSVSFSVLKLLKL